MAIVEFIISGLMLDIDTVNKSDGKYLRVRVEWQHITLADKLIPIGESGNVDWYHSEKYKESLQEISEHEKNRIVEQFKTNSFLS